MTRNDHHRALGGVRAWAGVGITVLAAMALTAGTASASIVVGPGGPAGTPPQDCGRVIGCPTGSPVLWP